MTASGVRSILPPLSTAQREHSAALSSHVAAELAQAGGWLSFERYMELVLYSPGLGYYSAGSAKIGAAGDFVTAPEVSALFSRCVARQCAAILTVTGGQILEFGAGTGRMAASVLTELAALGTLPQRYAILELSADLAARQRAHLAQLPARLAERVVWLERLPSEPLAGVVLANEVADALPCRRFTVREGAWLELGVARARGAGDAGEPRFCEAAAPPDAALALALADIKELLPAPAAHYTSEVCLRVGAWIAALGASLDRGALLLLDYGLPRRHYYHPQRDHGTLRCHFRQHAHSDPFIHVGLQDISAWVDFTRIAEAAVAADLQVAGFTTQAAFLLGSGLEELLAAAADGIERARLAGEARRLVMPEEMGEVFKVMALTRAVTAPLAGFALKDLRDLL
jgi:SAM-dependent MidA family methyltransferase